MANQLRRLRPNPEDCYLSFAVATFAAGISQKRVRNWIDRDLIYLDANADRVDASTHRRFTELDCIRIGIIGRLTRYGYSPQFASNTAEDMFVTIVEAKLTSKYKGSMADKLVRALQTVGVAFWYDEDDEEDRYEIYDLRKREPREILKQDTRLELNIGQLVQTIYHRVATAPLTKMLEE